MLALLSPAKTLDLTPLSSAVLASKPALLKEAGVVVKHLQQLTLVQLKSLLGVSDNLARLNHGRYKDFHRQPAKQAAFTFDGPAFRGLAAAAMTPADLEFAQGHLRILSGVYGVLRPCDLVRPYRLDMGKKLQVGDTIGMYKFWGTRLSEAINKEMPKPPAAAKRKKGAATDAKAGASVVTPAQFVLNCASAEYSKAVVRDALDVPVVDVVFREPSGKTVSVYAKRARGMMCRFLIQERVHDLEGVKNFSGYADMEQYKFSAKQSNETELVFTRVTGGGGRAGPGAGATAAKHAGKAAAAGGAEGKPKKKARAEATTAPPRKRK